MSYTTAFLRGLSWNGALKISSKLFSVLKLAVLARLLAPQDFGLFSLTLVAISLVEVFTETGINTIIIQSRKPLTFYLNTAWIVSIGRGVIIAAVMLTMSLPMSRLYQEPLLFQLIVLASLVPLLRGMINPAIIQFQKNLQFQADTAYRFSLLVFDLCATVILVFWLRNASALILPIVLTAVFELVISWVAVAPRPRFGFDPAAWKEIWRNSRWLNAISILDYLNKNADDLLIGRIAGVANLGMYRNGYALSQSGTADLSLSVLHASFPILSQMQDDLPRFRKTFLRMLLGFSAVLLIPTALFWMFPELILRVVLGEQWLSIAKFLPILAVSGFIQGQLNLMSMVFTATRTYRMLLLSLLGACLSMVLGIVFLTPEWGLYGAAIAILLSRIVALPILSWGVYVKLFANSPEKRS